MRVVAFYCSGGSALQERHRSASLNVLCHSGQLANDLLKKLKAPPQTYRTGMCGGAWVLLLLVRGFLWGPLLGADKV